MIKLIRDKYEETIPPEKLMKCRSEKQFVMLLYSKLFEEIRELAGSDFKDPNEYADILEILRTLAKVHNVDWKDVRIAKDLKKAKRGGFDKQLIFLGDEE